MRLDEEKLLAKDLKRFFRKLERKIQNIVKQYYDDELFPFHLNKVHDVIEESKEEYNQILLKHCLPQFYRGRETTTTLYTIQQRKVSTKAEIYEPISITRGNVGLFRTNPIIEDNLRNMTFTASQSTLNRVDDTITHSLADSYHEGLGIDAAGRKITKQFSSLKTWEANRIARTEINSAQSEGAYQVYDELGTEYQMWWTAQDERVRDEPDADHKKMHGKIVRVGTAFSNGLLHPHDKVGTPLKQWINCRCTTIPYIMPLGMMAPPGMTEFTEADLIPIPGFEKPEYDTVSQLLEDMESDNVDRILSELQRITDDWDLNRLGQKAKKEYLRIRKNYEILKDALENNNYGRLKDMDVDSAYSKYTSESFLRNIDAVKMDIEDYEFDLDLMEKTIKDRNIIADPKVRGIKWNNPELKDCYNYDGEKYVKFNQKEQFERYYFQDEDLTIIKGEDVDNYVMEKVYEDYKNLPDELKKSKEIVLSNQNPRQIGLMGQDRLHMGYVTEGKGNRITQFIGHRVPDTPMRTRINDTIIHESTHLLEKDANYYISNSKEYVEAFKKDQKRLLAMGKDLDETYVTPYARDFTEKALKEGSLDYSLTKHRPYSEDLAESMKMYLKDKKAFRKNYPNKAKVLDKILDGSFDKKAIRYDKWLEKEKTRFDISKPQKKRMRELDFKEDDGTLTRKERKELDYLREREEFQFEHTAKLEGRKYFNEKRYNELYDKFQKELDLPPRREILKEEKALDGTISFSDKEKEEYRQLKARVESGEKLKFKERGIYENYEKKLEFNRLYNKYGHDMPDFDSEYEDYEKYKDLIKKDFVKEHFGVKTAEEFLQIGKAPKPKPKVVQMKPEKPKEVIIDEHEGVKYKDFSDVTDQIDTHMEELQKDVKYKKQHIQSTRDWGGDTYYDSMNDLIYGNKSLEKNLKTNNLTKDQVKRKIKDLDETIEMSPGLDDDYILWKGGDSRGLDLTPGATNEWKGYSGTSFDRDVGEDYFEIAKERLEKQKVKDAEPVLFKIRAKKGTSGVYMDGRMQATSGEAEYLLGRGQKFKVISYDPNTHICEIELIPKPITTSKTNIRVVNELLDVPNSKELRDVGKKLNQAQRKEYIEHYKDLRAKVNAYHLANSNEKKELEKEILKIKSKMNKITENPKQQKIAENIEKYGKTDETKFKIDNTNNDVMGVSEIGELENKQIASQKNMNILEQEKDSLSYYYGINYRDIKGYYLNDDFFKEKYWSMNKAERREYIKEIKKHIKHIDKIMDKTEGLTQDTVLWSGREEELFLNLEKGSIAEWKNIISASYKKSVGSNYQADDRYLVKILAPKGTKGFAANDSRLNALTREHEFTLPRKQKFVVLDIDHKKKTVTVLLID